MIENATNLTTTTIVDILPTVKSILVFIFGFFVGSGVVAVFFNSYFNKKLQLNQQEFDAMIKIKDGFASDKMREAMMRLGKFKRKSPSTFVEIFSEMLNNGDSEADQINHDSGKYSHHFCDNVFGLLDKVDDAFIKRAVNISQVQLLLDVVDPLEKEKAEYYKTEYDENIAKECRRIFEKKLKKK